MKIITSKEALKRVAGGRTGFQILTPHETNEFKDLLSNLLVYIPICPYVLCV